MSKENHIDWGDGNRHISLTPSKPDTGTCLECGKQTQPVMECECAFRSKSEWEVTHKIADRILDSSMSYHQILVPDRLRESLRKSTAIILKEFLSSHRRSLAEEVGKLKTAPYKRLGYTGETRIRERVLDDVLSLLSLQEEEKIKS